MLITPAILALPLLASAVPTAREQLAFQVSTGSSIIEGQDIFAAHDGFSLDLGEMRLVQFSEEEPPVWMSELEKIQAKAKGLRFMDITDTPTLGFSSYLLPSAASVKYSYPTPGNHTKTINSIIKKLDIDHMKEFLTKFTSFRTRYYRSDTGKDSQKFLLKTLKEIASHRSGITVKEFAHPWGQNSIIVRFAPADPANKDAPITIVGSHQDSTNIVPFLPAPGADDDGSGTTSSLEGFRALVNANYTPSTPLEFHYFSAEEGGLLGSQAVAKSYEEEGKKVLAMLQMDMTAWVKAGTKERVGIIQDFVDPALTEFVESLVEEYLSIPPVKTQCSYACSDHASFAKAGYQSAFAIEATFDDSNTRNIHSTADTMDHPEFSFTHMREFSKLVVAFSVELAGIADQ
ncbi:hypothetical protein LQV05_006244 [Cryptococcus neoformans]|nr:bacterial leucyl aminopeptidase [Cryptococcus neoformans var. grubii c45]OXB35492.1 bacterial leucyl aminopeptidase [Cryptococcus neoformans var. grubii]OXC59632.1 bacterial leucyl aminopeptidase [Cryptococcus neoformans var. grubii MW-RSA852]UOH83514.1 hypothetical protein LQV05_006244 [Cryptococcus neoformans]